MLSVLSRDTPSGYTLLFPRLTSLSLIAHDWNEDGSLHQSAPAQAIEDALIKFFGQSFQLDVQPIRRLSISGIVISERCEVQLREVVEHVEVCFLFPCVIRCVQGSPSSSCIKRLQFPD
jgi:hypothetical protein